MPGLYDLSSNANVSVSNTTGLYQVSSNVSILNSAQTLLNLLSNTGNVSFGLTSLGTQVQAWAEIDISSSSIDLVGDVTGSGPTGSPVTTTLSNTGVTAGTYGSGTLIPVVDVDSKGRIISITTMSSAGGSYGNANVAIYLPTDATIISLQSNSATQQSEIVVLQGNAAGQAIAINNINSALNTLNANVGAFEITTSANIGSIYNHLNTLDANVGAFETYANATFGTSNYSNANVAAFLPTYNGKLGGNITIGGNLTVQGNVISNNYDEVVTGLLVANSTTPSTSTTTGALQSYGGAGIQGNLNAGSVYTNNYFYANGTPFTSSSYGNTNVSAYLQNYAGQIGNSAIVAGGGITIYGSDSVILPPVSLTVGDSGLNGGNLQISQNSTGGNVYAFLTPLSTVGANLYVTYGSSAGPNYVANTGHAIISNTLTAGGNISTSNYFIGDGSKLSNVVATSYGNVQVQQYLAVGNVSSINMTGTAAISSTNNIYISGSGALNNAVVLQGQGIELQGTGGVSSPTLVGITGNVNITATANVGNLITTSGVFWANGTSYSTGGSGTSFTGNLAGSTLYDSVNQRIFANAYPLSTPSSSYSGSQFNNYLLHNPVYNNGILQAPIVQSGTQNLSGIAYGFVQSGNVGINGSGQSSQNRNTTNALFYSQVYPLGPNAFSNSDRVRGATSSLDIILSGNTWGNMSTASSTTLVGAALSGQTDILGYGSISSVAGVSSSVQLVPVTGQLANVEYASGIFSSVSLNSVGGGTGNIAYARLIGGSISGFNPTLTVMQAIGLHTISGWTGTVGTLSSGAQSAYVVRNEDTATHIYNAGNIILPTSGKGIIFPDGSFQTSASSGGSSYGNANVAVYLPTDPTITNIQANIGAFETYANATFATQTALQVINANIGAFETYANATFGTSSYGNATVSEYLPHATGYTDAWLIPTGGNSARPSFAANGHIRFNTDIQNPEWYDGASSVWYPFSANVGGYTPPAPSYAINYVAVAGGGAGASGSGNGNGGGGGAGGVLVGNVTLVHGTTYTITVGAGGTGTGYNGGGSPTTGSVGSNLPSTPGSDTTVTGTGLSTIDAIGGGRGGSEIYYGNTYGGGSGGSGGGSSAANPSLYGSGTTGQGYAGGQGASQVGGGGGGGGGGAASIGLTANTTNGGNGGPGISTSLTGSTIYLGGGGGGAAWLSGGATLGYGGNGGGGNGIAAASNYALSTAATAGSANTGGGGGGNTYNPYGGGLGDPVGYVAGSGGGKNGGSGTFIMSIATASYSGTYTGTVNITTNGSNTVLQWTSSGTYTA